MTRPVITAQYDQIPVAVADVGFNMQEPDDFVHPRVMERFRKMLTYIMPQHVEQCYDPEYTTPESINASIDSLLENLTFEQLSELIWGTIEDGLEEREQEMHEA